MQPQPQPQPRGDANDISVRCHATLKDISRLMSTPKVEQKVGIFLASTQQVGPFDGYKIFPAVAVAVVDGVERDHGVEERRRFLRCAIGYAILATLNSARFQSLPPRVAAQQKAQLLRIATDADGCAEWLDIDHDLFQKELGLATMRLYAAGAQLIDFRCGIPRSTV